MSEKDLETLIFKIALDNALNYGGKTREKNILSKLMGLLHEKEKSIHEYIKIIKKVVEKVNSMGLEKQKELLNSILKTPIDILIKEKETKDGWSYPLPPLEDIDNEIVVTRFPPEPNGYLHLGHAKAAIIDYSYAQFYNGKFILRFDDTNPLNEKIEFYEIQKKDLKWLGIKWDEEYRTSDNLLNHYKYAIQLISEDHAYICDCPHANIKKNRYEGKECQCRNNSVSTNLRKWDDMQNSTPQSMILRFKGDMNSQNSAYKDPTLFRILDVENNPHPIHKNRFSVWPTYDMYACIEDSTSGVTHPFRTKEYELRDRIYFSILKSLKLRIPKLSSFSRLNMKGAPTSKRKIKDLIERNIVKGWDDPRLFTLIALRRRGIKPDAIKKFIYNIGCSTTESLFKIELLS